MARMIPWRMAVFRKASFPWWTEHHAAGRSALPVRMVGWGRGIALWEMRVQGNMAPYRMEVLEAGRTGTPWSLRIQTLDEMGTLAFHAQGAGGERRSLFEAPTVTSGPGGESVATFLTDEKCEPGAMFYLVATAEDSAIPLYRGVVSQCAYDAGKESYSVILRDPIGARLGQRVPTKSGAPLAVLSEIARQAGEALIVGELPERDGGTLADTDGTVPWLEYVTALEALLGGVLTWTSDGYVLESAERVWPVQESDCFEFSERADLDGYYNSVALVVDDSWTVPAERKVTVLPFAGGTVTKDAAGDQVYRVTVRVGDVVVSDQGWRYNGRHEVVWEGALSEDGRCEITYRIAGDPRVVKDKLGVSGRMPGTQKSGDPPWRSWDEEVNTSVVSDVAGDSVVVTRKAVTRTWEQIAKGAPSPEEVYPWSWPPEGTPSGDSPGTTPGGIRT